MRYVLAMVLMTVPASAEEEFPLACSKELVMVMLKRADDKCPNVKLTFQGHKFKSWAAGASKPECVSMAESKVRDDVSATPKSWCMTLPMMINPKGREPYVETR